MANVFDSRTIVLDTFSSDIDVGDSAFGLSTAPIFVKSVVFDNPTAADTVVLKNVRGEVVAKLTAGTGVDGTVSLPEPFCSEGLKILSADVTVTSGSVLIHLA